MTVPAFALADIAALIGVPARAAMLTALVDGRARSAGELAMAAHASAPSASLHLAKLVDGGLLSVHRSGRHRYYQLASGDVATALEALGAIATAPPPPVTPALTARQRALREARTCYDHLAGTIAVVLTDTWVRRGILDIGDRTFIVTATGRRWFAEHLAIDIDALEAHTGHRLLARQCLDWTERRPHVAGTLGAALLERFRQRRWVAPTDEPRRLRVTTEGRIALERLTR